MKTAIVHDDLVQAGGAERVAATLHRLFPKSPFYTSLYNPHSTLPYFKGIDVRTSFLQRTPFASRRLHKLALPWFPLAFEQFDLTGYDLVISSASRFAKGIITEPETCHVCYCHTPPRFAWRPRDYLTRSFAARLSAPLTRQMMCNLRLWDLASAQRVDYFVSNSQYVANRIQKFYRRDATVIPPPVETARYSPAPPDEVGEHFLVVSRLLDYKRVDLAIAACQSIGAKLHIIGEGPALPALRRLAGPDVRFLGRLPDKEVAAAYARCRALIFPGEEDFGLTPLECMASGRPVVAYGAGGALETMIEGATGAFFMEPNGDSMAAALQTITAMNLSSAALQAHASRFDTAVFEERMRHFTFEALQMHREAYGLNLSGKSFGEPEDKLSPPINLHYSPGDRPIL